MTIPEAERGEIAAQLYHLVTDQVAMMNFFYEATQRLIGKRLRNFSEPLGWNAQNWDVLLRVVTHLTAGPTGGRSRFHPRSAPGLL